MKKLKAIATSLLLFNGIGAIYGGTHLILVPDGSSIGLSLRWLELTPFPDYQIPGLTLFFVNGILSFITCAVMIGDFKSFPLLVMFQGLVLMTWIIIQIYLIRSLNIMHIIMLVVGISLLLIGRLQLNLSKQKSTSR